MSEQYRGPCYRRCPHGGVCMLTYGHSGDHDTRRCQFSESEALSDQDGDALFARNHPGFAWLLNPLAAFAIMLGRDPVEE